MLKYLACLLMLIDHVGLFFAHRLPEELVLLLRSTGRLAFPIFAWLVARGYARTRNQARYFTRMVVFALLAELVIKKAFSLQGWPMDWSNVLFTFALALALLSGYQLATCSFHDMIASLRPVSPTPDTAPAPARYHVRLNPRGITLDPRLGLVLGCITIGLVIVTTILLKPDYGFFGLAAVFLFYIAQQKFPEKDQPKRALQLFIMLHAVFLPLRIFCSNWSLDWAILQLFSILALPLCFRYDKTRRPAAWEKYFFYLFYPLHIYLLSWLVLLL